DDRVDLAVAKQVEHREKVLTKPLRVSGTATHGKRLAPSADGKQLMALAQLLDPVGGHTPARREKAPKRDGRSRRIPLDPRPPVLVPVREHRVVAVHDEPSPAPQRAEGAQGRPPAEAVEHDVHALSGELANTSQKVL